MSFINREIITDISILSKNNNLIRNIILDNIKEKNNLSLHLTTDKFYEELDDNLLKIEVGKSKLFFEKVGLSQSYELYESMISDISIVLTKDDPKNLTLYSESLKLLIPDVLSYKLDKNIIIESKKFLNNLIKVEKIRNIEAIRNECKLICRNISSKKLVDILIDFCDKDVIIQLGSKNIDKNIEVVCELFKGESFFIDYPDDFYRDIDISEINCVDILVIDGMIESVHEVHHLLEKYSDNKKNLVVVASNYGKDVIHTLITNYKKCNLNIFPLLIPNIENFKEELLRLSKSTNSIIISSEFGDRLSSIKEENIGFIKKIVFFKKNKKILVKRADSRISTHVLQIYVNEKNRKVEELLYEIDFLIKKYQNLTKQGLLAKDKVMHNLHSYCSESEDDSSFEKALINKMTKLFMKKNDSNSIDIEEFYTYIKNLISTLLIFTNVGGILSHENLNEI